MPDHEAERARLAGLYAAMSDEELRTIAESGDELSVPAQDALLGEASQRGFTLTIAPSISEEAVELNRLVTLRQFRDLLASCPPIYNRQQCAVFFASHSSPSCS